MKFTYLSLLSLTLFTNTSFANVTITCNSSFGESVYSTFELTIPLENLSYMPYELDELIGSNVILDGIANPNHQDIIPGEDEWSYVTLGPREAVIREGSEFYIETCKDCDFNSATYTFKLTNEEEIFITEMYGSDGSGEFSVYTCSKN